MRILFVHQNFPGQFLHLAPALAAAGHQVVTLCARDLPAEWQGVRVQRYAAQRGSTPGIHPWIVDLETKVIRGEAALRAARGLAAGGFQPDVIVAHPGWGESLFLKDLWPVAVLGLYCEFFYHAQGADVGFDPEFGPASQDAVSAIRIRNLNNALHAEMAACGLSPTQWQAGTYPLPFRQRITVAHDGIDTDWLCPDADAGFSLPDGRLLTRQDEVVTYASRNLEPTRGYHVFMRALPELLRCRPRAQVVIVGGDGVSYGAKPPAGTSWKQRFLDEVAPALDASRVHFVGHLPHPRFLALLQVSAVHAYLSYPFVLSWSLLEAMSVGCAIVGSNTAPVREVVQPGETGSLVDFFDPAGLAQRIGELLDDPLERARLGANARRLMRARYDLRRVCLPAQLNWVRSLSPRLQDRPGAVGTAAQAAG